MTKGQLVLMVPEYALLYVVKHWRVELEDENEDSAWTARDIYSENPLRVVSRNWRRLQGQVFFLVIVTNALMAYWYLAWDMPLMLSYLLLEGVNLWWIAAFRSAVAVISLVGIFLDFNSGSKFI